MSSASEECSRERSEAGKTAKWEKVYRSPRRWDGQPIRERVKEEDGVVIALYRDQFD